MITSMIAYFFEMIALFIEISRDQMLTSLLTGDDVYGKIEKMCFKANL